MSAIPANDYFNTARQHRDSLEGRPVVPSGYMHQPPSSTMLIAKRRPKKARCTPAPTAILTVLARRSP